MKLLERAGIRVNDAAGSILETTCQFGFACIPGLGFPRSWTFTLALGAMRELSDNINEALDHIEE